MPGGFSGADSSLSGSSLSAPSVKSATNAGCYACGVEEQTIKRHHAANLEVIRHREAASRSGYLGRYQMSRIGDNLPDFLI